MFEPLPKLSSIPQRPAPELVFFILSSSPLNAAQQERNSLTLCSFWNGPFGEKLVIVGKRNRGQQVPIFLLCGIALHVTVAICGGIFLLSRLH
jgi:hypothetical protein